MIGVLKEEISTRDDRIRYENDVENIHEMVISAMEKELNHIEVCADQIIDNMTFDALGDDSRSRNSHKHKIRESVLLKTLVKISHIHDHECELLVPSKCKPCLCPKWSNPPSKGQQIQPLVLRFDAAAMSNQNSNYNNDIDDKMQTDLSKLNRVTGPIAVRYKKFVRDNGTMCIRFLFCMLAGFLLPILLAIQTCVFWIYSDRWGYSNRGIQRLIEKYYRVRWGVFVLDFLYSLSWLKRPPTDPLVDVSLRSKFEAHVNSDELESKIGRQKSAAPPKDTPSSDLPSPVQDNTRTPLKFEDYDVHKGVHTNNRNTGDGSHDDNETQKKLFGESTVEWLFRQVCF